MRAASSQNGKTRIAAFAVTLVAIAVTGATLLTAGAGAVPGVDLALEKSDSPDPVRTGEVLTYTITVTHEGDTSATAATVEDTLPKQVRFVSAQPSQGMPCERSGRKVTCELGPVAAPDGTATVTIRVRPKKAGRIENTATVTVAQPEVDPNEVNNSDTERTRVVEGPTCAGTAPTIVGTSGDDDITGTDRADVVLAGGGNDTVNALGGKDRICGRAGADVLRGKADGDIVRGGGGRDKARGGAGDDTLRGGRKRDRLRGGSGDDLLNGGRGRDNCRGGPGDDALVKCP